MDNERKAYETPEVTKVEFDASDRITASTCDNPFEDLPGIECGYAM